jgi:6-phosphogluconolactonase
MSMSGDYRRPRRPTPFVLVVPLLVATVIVAVGTRALAAPPHLAARFVYVGTYSAPNYPPGGTHDSTALGIYVFRMEPRNGNLVPLQTVAASNPSFLAVDPSLTHVYAVGEDEVGGLSAYRINPADGTLTFQNTAPANGSYTTHIGVHPSGAFVFAANYGTGNFPIYRIAADGSIGANTDNFQSVGNGTGPNENRQEATHAHQILADLDAAHVFGIDLGADKVNVLNLDLSTGMLSPNTVPFAPVASGSGPRHMAFHPDRKHAYVLDELASSITVSKYDPARGALTWVQTISTLPKRFTGDNTAGEIRVHPSGRFLYSTNRGHESIAIYAIDPDTGELDTVGWESTRGEWPRGMNIDPSGTFLYVANQNTDTIVVFRVNLASGRLYETVRVHTPTPVDIEFGPTP